MSSAACLWKTFREVEHRSGASEKVFSFSPEPCSPSSRNDVQNQPGILFSFVAEWSSASPGFPTAQDPAGQSGAQLRRRLTQQGLRLALLGDDDETANREYIRQFVLDRDAEIGKKFGLAYAEAYHYIGPAPAKVEDYVRKNAVKI